MYVLLKYAYPNLDRNAYVMDAIYLAFVRWGKMEMKNENSCRGVIFRYLCEFKIINMLYRIAPSNFNL